ncbi:hypothetical protein [Micromonospora sp. NPDC023956]|uniref:hypothetical protein n=1 Tax=Micromonospora sp. NPDC023956 TaxID=3155722 RepID=UPI0033D8AF8D
MSLAAVVTIVAVVRAGRRRTGDHASTGGFPTVDERMVPGVGRDGSAPVGAVGRSSETAAWVATAG